MLAYVYCFVDVVWCREPTTKDLVLLPHVAHMIDTLPTIFFFILIFFFTKINELNMPHLIILLFTFSFPMQNTQHQRGINSLYVRVFFPNFWLTFIVLKKKQKKKQKRIRRLTGGQMTSGNFFKVPFTGSNTTSIGWMENAQG